MTMRTVALSLLVLALGFRISAADAAAIDISTSNPQNGLFDIYSATFDPPLSPCGGASPSFCSFFGGDPPATRQLLITPNPTTVTLGVPGGIEDPLALPVPIPAPAPAAFLNLTLGPGNASLTLSGGTLKFPLLIINIIGTPDPADDTLVTAVGAGFVLDTAPRTTAVDANGRAEFLVDLAPSTAVNFSKFSQVVTSCTGPQCILVPVLSLDMIRYRLVIDYDPTFGSFTGEFIGQTANNSMVFANLNSGIPDINVTDSLAPAGDLQIPFGDVTELTSTTQTLTVTNTGGGSLFLGNVTQTSPVPTPFATANDGCSGQTLGLADTCTVDVSFSPAFVGAFDDSLDLPSNDADEPSVRVAVSGSGVATPVPNIHVADSAPPNEDGLVPFGTVTQGGQADQTVTVTNNGTAALLIGQIAMDDALLPPFSVQADTCSNQTLAPSEPCTFGVRFEPTATGPFDDTFDIPSNDADTPTVVTVTGTGAATAVPDIRITDPTAPDDDRQLSFDDVRKSGSFERVITVLNVGAADLVIGVIGTPTPLSAPFSVVAGEDDCSGETIIPTGSCTVRLLFEPTAIDSFDDTFSVPSNDPDEPTVTVSVAGNGVESPPAASISPEGADSGFMALDPVILLLLGAGGACECRRRRRRAPAL